MYVEPSGPDEAIAQVPPAGYRPSKVRRRAGSSLLDPVIVRRALFDAFVKLDPRHMVLNLAMLLVELGSGATTVAYVIR